MDSTGTMCRRPSKQHAVLTFSICALLFSANNVQRGWALRSAHGSTPVWLRWPCSTLRGGGGIKQEGLRLQRGHVSPAQMGRGSPAHSTFERCEATCRHPAGLLRAAAAARRGAGMEQNALKSEQQQQKKQQRDKGRAESGEWLSCSYGGAEKGRNAAPAPACTPAWQGQRQPARRQAAKRLPHCWPHCGNWRMLAMGMVLLPVTPRAGTCAAGCW